MVFIDINPMPDQSGTKDVRSTKTSKRGSPYLRKALFNVMDTYIKAAPKEEPIYQFLDRKRAEGKPCYVYMITGANRFLRRYYAKVRDYLNELDTKTASSLLTARFGVPFIGFKIFSVKLNLEPDILFAGFSFFLHIISYYVSFYVSFRQPLKEFAYLPVLQ